MHKIVLLQAEVWDLEEANQSLIRLRNLVRRISIREGHLLYRSVKYFYDVRNRRITHLNELHQLDNLAGGFGDLL